MSVRSHTRRGLPPLRPGAILAAIKRSGKRSREAEMSGSYYLHNHWYVAAHSFEISGTKPLARKICDQAVVIFRGEDGNVGILDDRCPHRFAPLSTGEVSGNDIQCGYHGIRFG